MELRASALRLLRSAEPRRPRADLQGPQQFCSQCSTPPVRAQLAPRTPTHPPLLHMCALAPPDSSDLIKRAISFHPSGPQAISFTLECHSLVPGTAHTSSSVFLSPLGKPFPTCSGQNSSFPPPFPSTPGQHHTVVKTEGRQLLNTGSATYSLSSLGKAHGASISSSVKWEQ